MRLKNLLTIELDLAVGVIAAALALIMHWLNKLNDDVLISTAVVLIAIYRRQDSNFDKELRRRLFSDKPIAQG